METLERPVSDMFLLHKLIKPNNPIKKVQVTADSF